LGDYLAYLRANAKVKTYDAKAAAPAQ